MSGSVEPTEKNAKYILKKLQRSEKNILSKHDLLVLCRPLTSADCSESLNLLEDMNILKREKAFRANGGNPKETIKINPLIF